MAAKLAHTEIEAKFHLPHLASVRERLLHLGGQLRAPRTLERNWRYDTADGRFRRENEVLRLRQDRAYRLTYKSRLESYERRREIELEIADLEAAQALLESLDFEVVFIYEKYREILRLEPVDFMLDELPFGCFVEIEGGRLEDVQAACARLGFAWEDRLSLSYLEIFGLIKQEMDLKIRDATFESFRPLGPIELVRLGFGYAALHPETGEARDE